MTYHPLSAISPVDGRYYEQCRELSLYFSESALIRFRLQVEIEYLIELNQQSLFSLPPFNDGHLTQLRSVYTGYSESDAWRVKEIEKTTNHDVKAIEYFIREKLAAWKLDAYAELVHFALTSQDINNTAYPLSIKLYLREVYYKSLQEIIDLLKGYSANWSEVVMLSRTHGQPASPTHLGKEIQVFVERLQNQLLLMRQVPINAKFGGATGNFNAHHAAFPHFDWVAFSNRFISGNLGLERLQFTTQIEHYDNLCALFDSAKRINHILVDLNRDLWTYISLNYFSQVVNEKEVGSSAMPHKINPIDFENSEGNLGVANALFGHLSAKLPISRLQRDLTDSTVLRNVGLPFAHTHIAFQALKRGLKKLQVNTKAIQSDLENNWVVIAEGIQNILRRERYPDPYNALKLFTRKNEKITREALAEFINSLQVSDAVKQELHRLTPFNYTGIYPSE